MKLLNPQPVTNTKAEGHAIGVWFARFLFVVLAATVFGLWLKLFWFGWVMAL